MRRRDYRIVDFGDAEITGVTEISQRFVVHVSVLCGAGNCGMRPP